LKCFKIFKEGNTEDAVNLIQRNESIISDKKLHAKYSIYASLPSEKKADFDKLKAKPKKTSGDQEELAALKTTIKEYRKQDNAIQDEAFDYFEKLLDQTLVPVWSDILAEQWTVCAIQLSVPLTYWTYPMRRPISQKSWTKTVVTYLQFSKTPC
jgi:hypothetical protein